MFWRTRLYSRSRQYYTLRSAAAFFVFLFSKTLFFLLHGSIARTSLCSSSVTFLAVFIYRFIAPLHFRVLAHTRARTTRLYIYAVI